MISMNRSVGRLLVMGLMLGWGVRAPSTRTNDAVPANNAPPAQCRQGPNCPTHGTAARARASARVGTGYLGFSLNYHLGYGYGGDAVGAGPDGGYPLYGGPGYWHPAPTLKRHGGINPFVYYGGPGGPTPGHPQYFGGVTGLAPDQPVVTFETAPGVPTTYRTYGQYNGAIPYPESTFAPFTVEAATLGSTRDRERTSDAATANAEREKNAGVLFGIVTNPVSENDHARGLQITGILPDSPAEKAGLKVGDLILEINGYLTHRANDLGWIFEHAVTDKTLKIKVRGENEGKDREVKAELP